MTREEIIANILLCIELEGDGGTSSFATEERREMMAFMNQLRKDGILANEGLVDLGLPSGTMWAKCNLGAEKETDFGKFFQWGDIKGYNADEGHRFFWDTYKYGTNLDNITKYNNTDGKLVLDNDDDPVFVATNGKFKLPTKEQLRELMDNTNHEWTNIDGINGMKFWKKGTEEPTDGNSYIFIPAAGYCGNGRRYDVGSWGYVWSLSRNESIAGYAWCMYFYSGDVDMNYYARYYGFPVRGVVVPDNKKKEEPYDNIDDTDDGQPVDLGLPSGTLWQKCNLGAEKETDLGLFYQWGETKGYSGDAGHDFSWNTYKWSINGNLIKYNKNDGKLILDNEDDPAYVATDGRMKSPTKEQLQELIDYTNHEWIENFKGSGVNGMKFVSKSNDTKYIFIPAAGYCNEGDHDDVGSCGYIWSASRDESSTYCVWYMDFSAGNIYMYDYYGDCGFSVRGVLNK